MDPEGCRECALCCPNCLHNHDYRKERGFAPFHVTRLGHVCRYSRGHAVRLVHPHPDVVAWLRHVRAGLERNLVGTPAEGYTGALEISFYRSGVRLVLERGAVVSIDEWYDDDAKIRFTREAFTHLLCGRRGCRELTAMFADCSAPHIESVVLDSLFPPFKGLLWAVT